MFLYEKLKLLKKCRKCIIFVFYIIRVYSDAAACLREHNFCWNSNTSIIPDKHTHTQTIYTPIDSLNYTGTHTHIDQRIHRNEIGLARRGSYMWCAHRMSSIERIEKSKVFDANAITVLQTVSKWMNVRWHNVCVSALLASLRMRMCTSHRKIGDRTHV